MRKYLFIVLMMSFILVGCGRKEKAAVIIGDIEITQSEFEDAFMSSRFANQKEAGRKLFLDSLITKKLILKEAEKTGLDKNPEFLKDIQSFWEQALLKRVISHRSREFSAAVNVSEAEIKEYYRNYKETNFSSKELSEVHDQIRWLLLQNKQAQAMSQWVESLKATSTIAVDRSLLGIKD